MSGVSFAVASRHYLGNRCVAVPARERERVHRAFVSAPEIELRSLCEVAKVPVQSVLRLVMDGALHIDCDLEKLACYFGVPITAFFPEATPKSRINTLLSATGASQSSQSSKPSHGGVAC
jgi:hypothetical protein